RDVGVRLAIIHTVYLTGDFDKPPQGTQKRFTERSLDVACDRFDALVERVISYADPRLSWAVAAHSLRGVPLEAIIGLKVRLGHMPFHIHASEQRREVQACVERFGVGPVELLARSEVLDSCTTLVHATHLRAGEAEAIADTGAAVCFCPTTEADLGDGIGPASTLFQLGVPLCLGTDGETSLSLIAEARQLEMHERLRLEARNVLNRGQGDHPATHLLTMATAQGAAALGVDTGELRAGKWADFITLDLHDPSVVGADDHGLLSTLMFSSDSRALRDVIVGGRFIVTDGQHPLARDSGTTYARLAARIFRDKPRVDAA
ncbi:MAG TPA: amidohydrolase family protein, partial [Myxococcota bacterium]|nr:amidohydrolase family protein [Myxococcota bacterium]